MAKKKKQTRKKQTRPTRGYLLRWVIEQYAHEVAVLQEELARHRKGGRTSEVSDEELELAYVEMVKKSKPYNQKAKAIYAAVGQPYGLSGNRVYQRLRKRWKASGPPP